ncbi:MAG: ATP-binding cassette domain-containing protein, partial [Pseudorhodoplanes sp.]
QAGYGNHVVLRNLDIRIDQEDRIALLGANGNGKSTLVKLLANKLAPFSGHVTRAEKLLVGYFAQHQVDELNLDGSPYDHIRKLMPDAPETKVRGRTGAIGFSGKAGDTKVKSLSGGEKARLLLGLATFFGPNMIILDEPTNHLDIDSRAALIEAINDYPGAVILVSHDRFLLEACVERLWIVQNGNVTPYDGDLDDYRRLILSGEGSDTRKGGRGKEDAPKTGTENRKSSAQKRSELSALRKRVTAAEALTQKLTGQIEKLDATLTTLFSSDPVKAAQLSKERAEAADKLAKAEEEWLNASAALEAASV